MIALGSNLGDREATIRAAVSDIDAVPGVRVVAASGLVESSALKPAGVDEAAPSYLNAVILVETTITPLELLDAVNAIEHHHGRVRETVWGDRTLDIDLIAVGDVRQDSERLTLPHPRAWQRAFVLVPWAQVDPDAVIPEHGRVADLLGGVDDAVWEFPAAPLHIASEDAHASEGASA
ncbi:MAG TPA: 2-amino-4-hydroxy-6-hydroxymethyldihydropteridine diphosphokinase [Homoserinimonas sp.]|nr:2-amino-4-hydroxy-6-hydroxymethyldihydropteridine diphosphokinase [Homoserinimonas sp.]